MASGRQAELRALREAGAGQPVLAANRRAASALLGRPVADLSPAARFTDLGIDSLSALSFSTLLRDDARRRLHAAFDRGDPELLGRYQDLAASHLDVLAGDVVQERLGLDQGRWQRLTGEVDLCGQPVSGSRLPARQFAQAVREAEIGEKDIPHVSAGLIAKYAADLRRLGLL